jgi:hypothetical protein
MHYLCQHNNTDPEILNSFKYYTQSIQEKTVYLKFLCTGERGKVFPVTGRKGP